MAYLHLKKKMTVKEAEWPVWNEADACKDFAAAVHLEKMIRKY